MTNTLTFYVYRHIRKDRGTPFYIGKGKGTRAFSGHSRNRRWQHIANKVGFAVEILKSFESEAEAFAFERQLIALYRTFGLCEANIADGGQGPAGISPSAETRLKISKALMGNIPHNKGGTSWSKGKHFAPEHSAKISAALTGIKRGSGALSKSYKPIAELDIATMYRAGLTSPQIAAQAGVSIPTVLARLREQGVEITKCNAGAKKILCLTDGRVFNSIAEAATACGVFRENVRKVLNGKYKQTGKLIFSYAN